MSQVQLKEACKMLLYCSCHDCARRDISTIQSISIHHDIVNHTGMYADQIEKKPLLTRIITFEPSVFYRILISNFFVSRNSETLDNKNFGK